MELFSLSPVVLAEPRRSLLRAHHGPKMVLSAADGPVLARLYERGTHSYAVEDLTGTPVLGVDLVAGASFGKPRFRLTGQGGRLLGEGRAHSRFFSGRLDVCTPNATLRFSRTAPAGKGACRARVPARGGVTVFTPPSPCCDGTY
ncbi:hypothetical protein [Streptomyces sp. NPDC051219]|uniref:hypothetical protein n=1 Tax=Streptomyces sp. NPDC051219 TaxID=3155283 RepID=UPI0034452598